jgi:hypothetical protein
MSFCDVEKLQIIKGHLAGVPAWQKLTEDERAYCNAAILDGLNEIERKAFEYKRL